MNWYLSLLKYDTYTCTTMNKSNSTDHLDIIQQNVTEIDCPDEEYVPIQLKNTNVNVNINVKWPHCSQKEPIECVDEEHSILI